MIRELAKSEFYKCENLLNDEGHVEATAIIQGNHPGRVFVDNCDSPRTGLIWLGNNDGFFFIGDAENERFTNHINAFIDEVIYPEAMKHGLNSFIAIGNHPGWEKTIELIFEHRHMQKFDQNVYKLERGHSAATSEPVINKGYSVLKTTKELFEDNTIENIDFLRSKLEEFWSSPEEFFNKGIGYCIVYKNKIVSSCLSGFVADNVHGIDIETIEEHQGNKLGQKAAHSMVKECVSQGIVPYWDCEEANTPSNVIARNVGLMKAMTYFVYIFPLDRAS